MAINWEMAIAPDVVGNALAAFNKGREERRRTQESNALKAFASDPTNAAPINALIAAGNPQMAITLRDFQAKEQDRARDAQFRDAQSRYFSGLNGPGHAQPEIAAQPTSSAGQPGQAEPQYSDADIAFMEMMKVDPKRALEMQGAARDRTLKALKLADDAYDHAVGRLGNVRDDTGYQALLADMEARFQPLGVDVRSMVPPSYPGPEGMRKLLLSTLDAKDQLHAMIERDRLHAYVANLDADNARADRNTASLMEDRRARRTEIRRNHDQTDATRRRGQDRGGRQALPVVKTPEEARKLPSGTKFKDPSGQVRVVP